MGALWIVLTITQLLFSVIIGMYFLNNLRSQQNSKTVLNMEFRKETEEIKKLRTIKLNEPLSEKTRPQYFSEIIGQEKGIKALRAGLCGENPQHIIIYGPPGVGKTAAARLALKSAILSKNTPFKEKAPFVEVDATILQFDERSIADPLIGSVHDPIYQGAGAYGQAGIPHPKAGAVTKAHGGILFIDEIGELHSMQMNKLLKVLEDRKVILTSSYYSSENRDIPKYIHDIFQNGYPADFRLVGTTTRQPEEIAPALRSRCFEIFFRGLNGSEVTEIAGNACEKTTISYENKVPEIISEYSANGRDTVNIVQMAVSIVQLENRNKITLRDVEEVIEYGHYKRAVRRKVEDENRIGVVNGLAVSGPLNGAIMEIEAVANTAIEKGKGVFKVTGIIEEEELNSHVGKMKRISTAKNSVDNVMSMIGKLTNKKIRDYDIYLNFPGGMAIDGPSAGISIFVAIYSALMEKEISSKIAMTGEITIKGKVKAVGGVSAKIEAGIEAGVDTIIIPKENYQHQYEALKARIVAVETIYEVIEEVFKEDKSVEINSNEILAAVGCLQI